MPAATLLTPDQKRFIKKNRLKVSASEMARRFGYSEGVVQRWMKKNGLKVSAARERIFRGLGNVGKTSSTPEMDKYLRENYLVLPEKTMATALNKSYTFVNKRLKQLKLKKPRRLINRFKKESRFPKGVVPMNKGRKMETWMSPEMIKRSATNRFKKGGRSLNEKADGDITLRQSMPYKGGHPHWYIRISKGVWQELQIYEWEKKHGKMPADHVLACKDGDTLNCRPSNWYLLSKADNARRNSGALNLPDSMIAAYLAGWKNKPLKKEFLKHPELLEIKRQQIILKRSINESAGNRKKA